MNEKEEKKISKFLSLVLRHQPEVIGIELDQNGWTDVKMLIERVNRQGFNLNMEILQDIVDHNPKKRFALNEAKDKIRANQGHSIEIDLGYESQKPPDILYHGTGKKSVESILKTGLEKRKRHHVHLSADKETAFKVAARHGPPVLFVVSALQMYENQYEFYVSDNGVWLTDEVPPKYLIMLD